MTGIVWLASYPKSGNTWVRLFLSALRGEKDVDLAQMRGASSSSSDRRGLERFLDLDLVDLCEDEIDNLRPAAYRAMARGLDAPLVIKTHDRHGPAPSGEALFPSDATKACVLLLRDPRDVCLSLAAHNTVTVDQAIDQMGRSTRTRHAKAKTQVREIRGSWSEHGASWLAAPMRVLAIRYEDMVADPLTHLGAIAKVCGLDPTPQALASAVRRTEFSRLAAKESESGFRERPDGMKRFFRSGKAGLWRECLTCGQIARIERDHAGLMLRLGYELEQNVSRSAPDASG